MHLTELRTSLAIHGASESHHHNHWTCSSSQLLNSIFFGVIISTELCWVSIPVSVALRGNFIIILPQSVDIAMYPPSFPLTQAPTSSCLTTLICWSIIWCSKWWLWLTRSRYWRLEALPHSPCNGWICICSKPIMDTFIKLVAKPATPLPTSNSQWPCPLKLINMNLTNSKEVQFLWLLKPPCSPSHCKK